MRALAYDVSRLFLGPLSRAPRGIDRIDLILAQHFFADSARPVWGVLPTPWGIRVFDAERVKGGLRRLERIWREDTEIERDPAYRLLRARLTGQKAEPGPIGHRFTAVEKAQRMLRLIGGTGLVPGRSARRRLPQGAGYLNIGQLTLGAPFLFRWLDHRPDLRAIFMLHDVIPIEFPHLVEPAASQFHATATDTAARYGHGIIVSTDHARLTVSRELAQRGRSGVPMLSAMLPLHQAFDTPAEPDPALNDVDYYIAVGAIEARKNLMLLADLWEALVERMGPATPRLILAGSPHFGGGEIKKRFADSSSRRYVHFMSQLSTPAIKTLISGARGLLMPSFAEGFGLPIVEAHALGCPVFASDIPAHREVTEPGGRLLPPDDPQAWLEALTRPIKGPRPMPLPRGKVRASRKAFAALVETFVDEID